MWRLLRIGVLLTVLGAVVFHTLADRHEVVQWRTPLWVGLFPLAGDDSPATRELIESLTPADFEGVAKFLARESQRYGRLAQPVRLQWHVGPHPPLPPRGETVGLVSNAVWSLRLRWYAWRRASAIEGARPRIRVFVVYHDPARTVKVPHSVGLQKGLLGVVHAFADRTERGGNEIVIAHELLHTLGASDKYDERNQPVWPDGYADPDAEPRLPQMRAEIMAGRRAVSAGLAEMPATLLDVVVGRATAREIGWVTQ